LVITDSRFENCRSTGNGGGGAIYTYGSEHEITGTVFINCTSRNDYKILDASKFAFIRNCTFTHDNNLADLGTPTTTKVMSVFGSGSSTFENCTFNNLRSNFAGENYLFSRFATYWSGTNYATPGVVYTEGELTLRNCTFNFNPGSAGLLALYAGDVINTITGVTSNRPDYLLMDGCRINNNGGQQPLIWLNDNRPAGTFRFRANNYYNGTLLNNQAAIINLASTGIMRLTWYAMPVMVE
jgi:hypothetical protein